MSSNASASCSPQQPDQVLDLAAGPTQPRWFPGAELNIVSSCFLGDGYDIAVVVGREGSDEMEAVTYEELEMLVNLVANGLAAARFSPGDAIALYMPMNLECVAAYLGIIRAGCVVVSIADSFAAPEVARRLEIAKAAAIITVSTLSARWTVDRALSDRVRSRHHACHRDRSRGILGGLPSRRRPDVVGFPQRRRLSSKPSPAPPTRSPTFSFPPAPPATPRPSRGPT